MVDTEVDTLRRDPRCQIDVGSEDRNLVVDIMNVTAAKNRKRVVVEALRHYANSLNVLPQPSLEKPRPTLENSVDIASIDAHRARAAKSQPQSLGSAAMPVVDTPLDPEPQSEPETEPIAAPSIDPLDAMRSWVNTLDDEPGESTSIEDWQRLKRRVGDVARQAQRLMEHGWSLRGLFGWPSGLVAQAYRRRCTFTSLHDDGRVVMTPEGGGDTVTVDPINETDEECPSEED
jgi:hypothetical protein